MHLTLEAVYEDGVLKPVQPLTLKEHQRVRITIQPAPSLAESTYGMLGWKGSHEALEQLLAETDEPEAIL